MILDLQLDPARELAAIQNYANVKARLNYPKRAAPVVQIERPAPVRREREARECYAMPIGPQQPLGLLRPVHSNAKGRREDRVIAEVARAYRVGMPEFLSRRRYPGVLVPRQVAMYALVRGLGLPVARAARLIGGRDHSCALAAMRTVEEAIAEGRLDDPLPRLFPDRVAV
jgi:hypothetical protein